MAKKKTDSDEDRKTNWLELFLTFISYLTIDSKETGVGPLNLYGSQMRFLAELIDGLDNDIHQFVFLKARQLGISTVSLAVDLFWLVVHPGLQGALVTDTDGNRDKFRVLITRFIASLPKSYEIKVKAHNRNGLVLENGSTLDYLVAGTRKSATEVGRSRAYNFLHATEVSNYGAIEGIVSLFATLAEKHPDRLYIFESTAKGYNIFWTIWQQARADPMTQKAAFIGWWANEQYSLDENSELFKRYWDGTVDADEQEKVNNCWAKYGARVTPGQIAWYRWKQETRQASTALMDQDFPWDEDDAFLQTGQTFFPVKRMATIIKGLSDNPPPFRGYAYEFGDTFDKTRLLSVSTADEAHLKIYEDPSDMGIYVMGVDPAYGRSENQDRSVVEVYRCYSDRLVQVAEFASSSPEAYQCAWVMAHLAGVYKDIMIIVEVSGPGEATVLEMKHLRQLYDAGAIMASETGGGIDDLFGNARWFMYHRTDSPGAGYVYNWKCLALDTPIPTPDGWTTMGEVCVGDYLFSEKGLPCEVRFASPVMLDHECFRITFDDRTSIVADADHLWPDGNGGTLKTIELEPGHTISVTEPLHLQEKQLPIDPYVLGLWLGDGSSSCGLYSANKDEIDELSSHIQECGFEVSKIGREKEPRTTCYQTILGLKVKLREAGILNNKHIPTEYLRGSLSQRISLLQGLMDTDGSINKIRQCSFTTTTSALAEGFSELLRGLGIKAVFCVRTRTLLYKGENRDCAEAYQFSFTVYPDMFPVFWLSRKKRLQTEDSVERTGRRAFRYNRSRKHVVVSIDPVESVPVRCVGVNSESNLYLAGTAMIPTHNTNLDNKLAVLNQLRDSITLEMVELRSIQLALEIQSLVQDGFVIEPAVSTDKDDRVFGSAFAHRAWTDWIRGTMIQNGDTWERVTKRELEEADGKHDSMVSHIVSSFFQGKEDEREEQAIEEQWK